MTCESHATRTVSQLALPVLSNEPLGGHTPKGSRTPHSTMGWKRATVLGFIQLLMLVHVAVWLWTGSTFRPIEPSESIETAKDGIITVGTLFFVAALASTAILGRWFCGWGCHIVMLQDLCGHLMKRVGIRPKLFRSRLLLWLPLCLAVYMFLWPLFYRFAIAPFTREDLVWPGFTSNLVTTDFWATFPGWMMAVPFLLVCGFLTVYLLGAKGYCTYGCPYGGFFAPLDELSPLRIRVTDACTQCGHCTSVCTSNVRVHEEVRDFKMVVDQGCMKCLDCVSACPEQALHVGFGLPAFLAKPRTSEPAARRYDLTWNEEIVLAVVAIAAFFAVRGAIGVPLLFASGIAACATYFAWMLTQLLHTRDVRFHRAQLKREGRITSVGVAMMSASVVTLGGLAYVGTLNTLIVAADLYNGGVVVAPESVFSGNRVAASNDVAARAAKARALYRWTLAPSEGIGFNGVWTGVIESRIAWLSAVLGEYDEAERVLRRAAARDGMNESYAAAIARVMRGGGNLPGALEFSRAQWEANQQWGNLREELVVWLLEEGRRDEALAIARRGVASAPENTDLQLMAMRRLSLLLVEGGNPVEIEEGLAIIDRTLEMAPGNPYAMRARATALRGLDRMSEAEEALRMAISINADEWRFYQDLGELLLATDRTKEGAPFIKQAGEMRMRAQPQ